MHSFIYQISIDKVKNKINTCVLKYIQILFYWTSTIYSPSFNY